jgi:hypothetical protein
LRKFDTGARWRGHCIQALTAAGGREHAYAEDDQSHEQPPLKES